MKKWMITYSLFLFFTGLYLSGHPGEMQYHDPVRANSSFIVVKKISTENHSGGNDHGDYKRIQVNSRSTAPAIPYFFLAERAYQVPGTLYRQQQVLAGVTNEIIGNRLQHLFPFHYFW